jgi:2-hydroxychromene-2-carboxylate isomerase
MEQVTFFFDPISPYVWLAGKQLARLEAAGCELHFQPVLFAGLLHAHGQTGPAEIAAKRIYTFRDVMRQASRLGLTFSGPPGHPFNPLLALRMCLALDERAARQRFALALFDACWEQGADLADSAVLIRIAGQCGVDGAAMAELARQPELKRRLALATEQAIADGVFGVPTFQIGRELVWGADRIDTVLWHLAGHRIDETVLRDFLGRPASAHRKGQ